MKLPAFITTKLCVFADRIMRQRGPDFIIGADAEGGPYLLRWYVTPWRAWFCDAGGARRDDLTGWQRIAAAIVKRLPNVYLHRFLRDDDDRALHDHPWLSASLMLFGGYIEHTIAAGGIHRRECIEPGTFRFLRAKHAHRVELFDSYDLRVGAPPRAQAVTLFITGPVIRHWGFHCPQRGWVPWREFTADGKPGEVGKGCEA